MKKFELKVQEVSNLLNLTSQISGTLANWRAAEKIEKKILLNEAEVSNITVSTNEKGEPTYDTVKVAKTVELSDDEFELLKVTLAKLIVEEETKASAYSAIKVLIGLDKLLNGETETTTEEAA